MQTVTIIWIEHPMWNSMKLSQVDSEGKSFKYFTILHMYIA